MLLPPRHGNTLCGSIQSRDGRPEFESTPALCGKRMRETAETESATQVMRREDSAKRQKAGRTIRRKYIAGRGSGRQAPDHARRHINRRDHRHTAADGARRTVSDDVATASTMVGCRGRRLGLIRPRWCLIGQLPTYGYGLAGRRRLIQRVCARHARHARLGDQCLH